MRKFKQVLTGRGSGYSIYSVNGGALRRWGLALLVMIVEFVYKNPVYAWVSTANTASNCSNTCRARAYPYGLAGAGLAANGIDVTGISSFSSTACYCFTTAENAAITSCSARACSTHATTIRGNYAYRLNSNHCGPYFCYCPAGSYVASSTAGCVACNIGYYCPGTSFNTGAVNNGGGRNACSIGYYCSTSQLSTQTICPAKYYTSTTAQSSCKGCSAGYYCPGGSSYACPAGRYCPTSLLSAAGPLCSKGYYCSGTGNVNGTKCPNNPPATTTTTGRSLVTQCYVPANSVVTETVGSYIFTSDCYYAS